MKKILFILILISTSFSFLHAQNKSKVGTKYAAVISFNSFGTGTPSDKPLRQYITKFKKSAAIGKICADKMGPFGREGEYKLGFVLKELNVSQKRRFLSGLIKVVAAMKDKGNAELLLNQTINLKEMNERATTEIVTF